MSSIDQSISEIKQRHAEGKGRATDKLRSSYFEDGDTYSKKGKKNGFGGKPRGVFEGKSESKDTKVMDRRSVKNQEVVNMTDGVVPIFPDVDQREEINQQSKIENGREVVKLKKALGVAEKEYEDLDNKYEELLSLEEKTEEQKKLEFELKRKLDLKDDELDSLEDRIEKFESLNALWSGDSEINKVQVSPSSVKKSYTDWFKGTEVDSKSEDHKQRIEKFESTLTGNKAKGPTPKERYQPTAEQKNKLIDLGYSENQISWVLNKKDIIFILKNDLKPEDWINKKRATVKSASALEQESKINSEGLQIEKPNTREMALEDARKLSLKEKKSLVESTKDQLRISEGFLKEAKSAGEVDRIKFYESDISFLKEKLEILTRETESSSVSTNKAKDSFNPISATRKVETIEPMVTVSDNVEIRQNPFEYRRETTTAPLSTASEMLQRNGDVAVGPQNLDNEIEGAENVIKSLQGVSSAEQLVEEKRKRLEYLKSQKAKEIEKEVVKENPIIVPRELKDLGWTDDNYNALSEDKKQFVYWHKAKPEDVIEGSLVKSVLESKDQAVELVGVSDEEKMASEFLDSVWEHVDIKTKTIKLSKQDEEKYNKNKEAIDIEFNRRVAQASTNEKREKDLTSKGVSAGAKEFIKGERVAAEDQRSVKDLSARLEQGYENLSKERLIEIAKERGLASGGDKQVLMDRIIKDDIAKGNENFGFTTPEISEKLKEFNISEKQMALISPEFFSLSPEKQRYLISKIEQKIYLDADINSKIKTEEDISKKGFFAKITANLKKGWTEVKTREALMEEYKLSVGKEYQDDISVLSAHLQTMPELKYVLNPKTKKLEAEFQYFELEENKESDNYWNKKYFNQTASKFGEVPKEWSSNRASKKEQNIYKRAEEEFEKRKNILLGSLIENGRRENKDETEEERQKREAGILIQMNELDGWTRFNSTLSQNPEIGTWSKDFFEKAAGGNVLKRAQVLGFMGFGALVKSASRKSELAGVVLSETAQQTMFYAGMGFSVVLGGYMGYRKKGKQYQEKEYRQQFGIEARAGKKNEKDKAIKKFGDAKISSERINKEIEKIKSETNEDKKQKLLESLKNRVFVVREMMEEDRMNDGNLKDKIKNRQALLISISNAEKTMLLNNFYDLDKGGEPTVFEQKLLKRFTDFIGDKAAEKYKNEKMAQAAIVGALTGAAGYYVGGLISEKVEEYQVVDRIKDAFDNIPNFSEMSSQITSFFKQGNPEINLDSAINETAVESASSSAAETTTNAAENYSVVKEVMAGSRGVIGAIDDLQDSLKEEFGKDMPPQYVEFMSKNPHVLAQEWGFYKPGEINESAKIMKGEGFSIDSKGVVRLMGLNGTDEVYVPEGVSGTSVVESERSFFDSGRGQENLAGVETEPSINKPTASISDYESPSRPEQVNEGYVRSGEVKPDTTSWFEKPVPTEFGASNIRGTWNFIEDQNGNIKDINTSRTISDDVINFRKNPRKFMTKDLSSLNMTDSTAVRILTENRPIVEELIIKEHILNAPNSGLNSEQLAAVKLQVVNLEGEVKAKTGGVFESKYPKPKAFENPLGIKPTKIVSFDTDAPVKPQVNPSVSSVSEGADFVPKKEVVSESIESSKDTIGKPEIVSLSANEKTYSLNTDSIRGQIRFIFDEDGNVDHVQLSHSTRIKGLENTDSFLIDDWKSKALNHSKDEAIGIKKIQQGVKILEEYKTIIKAGGFKEYSPEYIYMKNQISHLENIFKDVLK